MSLKKIELRIMFKRTQSVLSSRSEGVRLNINVDYKLACVVYSLFLTFCSSSML